MDTQIIHDPRLMSLLMVAKQAHVRRAQVKAIRETAFQAKDKTKRDLARNLQNPTKFTINGVFARKIGRLAKNKPFQGMEVGFRDEAPKGTPGSRYLHAQIMGGYRDEKRGEMWIKQAGLMPGNYEYVPVRKYRNASNDIKRNLMTRILSDLRAFPDYMDMNRSQPRSKSKTKHPMYFAVKVNPDAGPTRKLPPGIYKITGRSKKGTKFEMVLYFRPRKPYKQRYPWYVSMRKFVGRQFPMEFRKYHRIYNRQSSPEYARFLRAQKNIHQKARAIKSSVGLRGPLPRA